MLEKYVLANFFGKGSMAIVIIVVTPIYIGILGIESYALIGVFLTLQSVLLVFDLGLSTTLNREISRRSAHVTPGETGDLVFTIELFYLLFAFLIALAFAFSAPWLGSVWLVGITEGETIVNSIRLMGFALASQWPLVLYSNGLMGLGQQVAINGLRTVMILVQAVGTVLVLRFLLPTIEAFFYCQLAAAAVQTLLARRMLWSALPPPSARPRINIKVLSATWPFSAGVAGISTLGVALTQLDKAILSKLLPLVELGHYFLATTFANYIQSLALPFRDALFPRFAQLVSAGKESELATLYHKTCQSLAVVVFPISFCALYFAQELLTLWIRQPDIVHNTYRLAQFMIAGSLLNACVSMAYVLQLAYGWTSLSIYKNVIAIVFLVPLLLVLIHFFGAIGAAACWFLLNAAYLMFEIPAMHQRILRGHLSYWYLIDIALPALCCTAVGFAFSAINDDTAPLSVGLAAITGSWLTMTLACLVALPHPRVYLRKLLSI